MDITLPEGNGDGKPPIYSAFLYSISAENNYVSFCDTSATIMKAVIFLDCLKAIQE